MGFGIKVPMFPFHTWLPDAHTQAPTAGLGHPGRRAPEARHLRLHPHRHPDPPRGGRGLGAVDRAARRHRHHLRRARLPGPDRHEAAHRLLVGGPHGLRDARHRHPHRLRHQRRHLRHGRPRPHHRHALLHRRLGEGALPHARDQAPRRPADRRRRTWAGCSASAAWPRSACPAWPGSGASSRHPVGLRARRAGLSEELFRVYMVIAAIGTIFAAGYLLWLLQRVAFGTPTDEFARTPTSTTCTSPSTSPGCRCWC